MPYRLIVSDLDDTLLNEQGLISPATFKAVQAARSAGADIALASGRMPCAMRAYARQLNTALPMISYNGAELTHPETGEIIHQLHVPLTDALELLRYCEEIGLHIQAYVGDDFLTPEANELAVSYREMLHNLAGMRVTGQPLSRCVTTAQPKMLAITTKEQAPEYLKLLRARFGDRISFTSSKPHYIECVSPLADKGRALLALCENLNIRPEEVIAFGDGLNDLPMLKAAGLGCAMANAREEVRAQADLVAPSNKEDGVAQVIMQLISEGKIGKGA